MNKRQVLLAAAIASLSLVNVAQANDALSISDVAVEYKASAHSCSGFEVKEVASECKGVANDCSGQAGPVKEVANACK